jgi:hypothetical protein
MKKSFIFLALGAVMVAFSACSLFGNKEVSFSESDLIGTWQENGTEAFVRFLTEKADSDYKYGYEWNEAEDVFPEDLVKYGNGWFKWKLVKADLTEIHLMDNGGAEIPKIYTVTRLTDTDLEYKDDFGVKHAFSKVVSKK